MLGFVKYDRTHYIYIECVGSFGKTCQSNSLTNKSTSGASGLSQGKHRSRNKEFLENFHRKTPALQPQLFPFFTIKLEQRRTTHRHRM